MAFYGQKNYNDKVGNGPYTIAQIGCFVASFCNLEQRFGKNVDPPSLNKLFAQRGVYLADPADGAGVRDDLGWASITAYDPAMHVVATGADSWPSSNNAIVKFVYKSPHNGQMMTHFCLVADHVNHTIVDSWDGIVKSPGYYGEPHAWAIYDEVIPQPVPTPQPVNKPPAAPAPVSTAKDGSTYTFVKGDTVWSVAMRFGFSAQDLMDHNGITASQVRELPVGYVIHFPVAKAPPPQTSGVKYEILAQPKQMHVSKPGGAEKWGFGNIKSWTDFVSTQHVPENSNIVIVGIAHVLIGKETAAYYMDSDALGDYAKTGLVKLAVGYNWKDLADGFYVPITTPKPEPTPAPKPEPAPKPTVTPAPGLNEPAPPSTTASGKGTYTQLPGGPEMFLSKETMMVKEIDGRRPDHPLHKNQGVQISGTFIYNGTLYGRPTAAISKGYWFAIPMDNLISENELFNTKISLPDKVQMRTKLSAQEELTVVLAKTLALGTKIANAFKKK